MQLVHLKYYQLNHLTEKNDWVLYSENPQELPTKKTIRRTIFESFYFLNKEQIPIEKRKHNK